MSPIYRQPAELLQKLIRFNTTNPPGNEAECIQYLNELVQSEGIMTTILSREENRPNLIAHIKGEGNAPPLLLYGHVDVVSTTGQEWTHPPFEGIIDDGYIWGRGALDMKGGVAMMLSAFLQAHADKAQVPGDVIIALVSDEEGAGSYGARYLVEEHADLFDGVKYAIGEFGGFTMYIGGKRFYPIMVSEKQVCWLKATLHGPAGHGSLPMRGGAAAKLANMLHKLDQNRLPMHITTATEMMINTISKELSFPTGMVMKQLLNPMISDRVLDMLGDQGRVFDALLHHTVNATMIHGGDKINVIPAMFEINLDGRLLPGFAPDDLIRELHALLGEDISFEIIEHDPGPERVDMGLFDLLSDILKQADPNGIPVPMVLSGVTDGRFFSRLGIQTYGYLPMRLDPDFNFISTIHAANERIPVEAVEFGTHLIYQALQRFDAVR